MIRSVAKSVQGRKDNELEAKYVQGRKDNERCDDEYDRYTRSGERGRKDRVRRRGGDHP